MTKKVYLHVGTPKTGTSYLQHVLFHNRRMLRRARHPLSGRPVRRALPGRARPDADAVGRARGAGHRRLGHARRRGTTLRTATRSSATRSSPPRPASQIGRALESLGHDRDSRDPPRALGARPRAPDPGRVAGERQAPRGAVVPRVPRPDPGPAPRGPHPDVVLGRPGDPRHPGPLGPRPAARARARRHRAARRWRARPALEAVRRGVRPRRHRPPARRRAGQPVARRRPRPR